MTGHAPLLTVHEGVACGVGCDVGYINIYVYVYQFCRILNKSNSWILNIANIYSQLICLTTTEMMMKKDWTKGGPFYPNQENVKLA